VIYFKWYFIQFDDIEWSTLIKLQEIPLQSSI
jgi:hypothetical protein